ncbi:hypothetical protein [Catellatospora sp. NPDC049133]|jgi:hypothetical protein|uniref:hypothetical protein n=1 Tax=Catellatospora sp. NPDC049133 TaxID=3155499 RepID=UPI0033F3AA0C
MHALAERELDPLPFLVLGLAMLGIGLVLLWRGVRLRRAYRGSVEREAALGTVFGGAEQEQDPRRTGGRDPADWLRIFVEGLLLAGVGSAFTVHALSRLLS